MVLPMKQCQIALLLSGIAFALVLSAAHADAITLRHGGTCWTTPLHKDGSAYTGPLYIQCPEWEGHSLGSTFVVQGDTRAIRLTLWAINTHTAPKGALILSCDARRLLMDELVRPEPRPEQHEMLFTFEGKGPTVERGSVILPIEGAESDDPDAKLVVVRCTTRRGRDLWLQIDFVYVTEQAWIEEIRNIAEK